MALDLQGNIALQFNELARRWDHIFSRVVTEIDLAFLNASYQVELRLDALNPDEPELWDEVITGSLLDPIAGILAHLRRLNAHLREERFVDVLRWELETYRELIGPFQFEQQPWEDCAKVGNDETYEDVCDDDDEGDGLVDEEE